MAYSDTLRWLQGLLDTAQSTYAQQFGQGLTAQQQALADVLGNQRTMQSAQLGEGGRQFDASLALQKVMADWQNQLALKDYGLKSEAQKVALAGQRQQMDPGWQFQQYMYNKSMQPESVKASNQFLTDFLSRTGALNPTVQKFNAIYGDALGFNPSYGSSLNLGIRRR